ncbi:MAG: hypothetical protein ACMXYK_04925, partial [Candidatus Woesearchaeota archaeon]
MTVNYYALHYHMKNSGVKFVINNIFDAIKEYGDSKLFVIYDDTTETYNYESVQSIGLPEIGYNEKTYKSYVAFDKAAKELSEKIESVMKLEEPCVLHAHNVNLCKNTLLGRALYHLSHRNLDNLKILMQVHDFAEDGREHLLKHMQTCVEGATESEIMSVAYPQAKNITYSTINSRDQKILSKIGIKNVFFFPNNINSEVLEMEPKISGLSQALSAYAKKHGYVFDPDRRTLLSPIKIIERKNVVETLSVLEKLNAKKDEWQLLITLDAHSENDKAYAHA